MLFQRSSFLFSIVLSLNLAVSLSFSDALLRLSPSLSRPFIPSTGGNSRLAFTHLSYKSKPYHDGAETTPPPAAAAATTTDVKNEHVHVPPTIAAAATDTSIEQPSPQETKPKKKRSRVVKTGINDSRVRVVTTLEQFYECFEGECNPNSNQGSSKEQQEMVIIVRFFSHWCKSCQAIAPKYNRLARLYPNNVFIDIAVTKDNVDLQKALNIQAVPFGHIYYPKLHRSRDEEGNTSSSNIHCRGYDKFHLVEELKMGKMYWSDFEDIFQSYMTGQCSVAGMDYVDPIACKRSTIREYMVPSEGPKVNL